MLVHVCVCVCVCVFVCLCAFVQFIAPQSLQPHIRGWLLAGVNGRQGYVIKQSCDFIVMFNSRKKAYSLFSAKECYPAEDQF